MQRSPLELLLSRRSVVANKLGPPGPDSATLHAILTAAARVPDHKKLVPWRFVVFEGDARETFGRLLAAITILNEPGNLTAMRIDSEAGRLLRAPVVVAVIASPKDRPGVPEWEQTLSAGACCQNLLTAAVAAGFSAQWITEWYSFDPDVRALLQLSPQERVAGFIYIGTAQEPPVERDRPDLEQIVTNWQAPRSD